MTIVSDRTISLLIGLVLLLIYPRLYTRFGMNLIEFFKFLNLIFWGFIWPYFIFLINRQLRVILDGKSSHEHPVNAGVRRGPILRPTLVLLYFNTFPDVVICNIAIYADDTTLCS